MPNSLTARRVSSFPMSFIDSLLHIFTSRQRIEVPRLPEFDIDRFMGVWYEAARTDTRFERGLSDVCARYSRNANGTVTVTNRGYDARLRRYREANALAVRAEAPNFFKVYFIPFIPGIYQVANIDAEYRRALIAGGSTQYGWILSRDPELSDDEMKSLLDTAAELGYDPLLFKRTPRTADPM